MVESLKVAEMSGNNVLDAEAGGVKDQGNSILLPSSGKGSKSRTTEHIGGTAERSSKLMGENHIY